MGIFFPFPLLVGFCGAVLTSRIRPLELADVVDDS
jgi:hypothetical protein